MKNIPKLKIDYSNGLTIITLNNKPIPAIQKISIEANKRGSKEIIKIYFPLVLFQNANSSLGQKICSFTKELIKIPNMQIYADKKRIL